VITVAHCWGDLSDRTAQILERHVRVALFVSYKHGAWRIGAIPDFRSRDFVAEVKSRLVAEFRSLAERDLFTSVYARLRRPLDSASGDPTRGRLDITTHNSYVRRCDTAPQRPGETLPGAVAMIFTPEPAEYQPDMAASYDDARRDRIARAIVRRLSRLSPRPPGHVDCGSLRRPHPTRALRHRRDTWTSGHRS
jgi:hypothetical protein